jgi:NAD/NADP transhydrogenase alpha subunit
VVNLLGVMLSKEGELKLDLTDEIVKAVLVSHEGKLVNEMVAKSLEAA